MPERVEFVIEFERADVSATNRAVAELRKNEGIMEIGPASGRSSVPGRSGELLDFSRILVAVAPEAIRAFVSTVTALFNRPGAPPVKVKVSVGGASADVEFDPRVVSAREITGVVERIAERLATAPARPA